MRHFDREHQIQECPTKRTSEFVTFSPSWLCPFRQRVPNTKEGNKFQEILVWSCLTLLPFDIFVWTGFHPFFALWYFPPFFALWYFQQWTLRWPCIATKTNCLRKWAQMLRTFIRDPILVIRCFFYRLKYFFEFKQSCSASLLHLICLTLSDSICFEIWNIEKMIYRKNKTRWTS